MDFYIDVTATLSNDIYQNEHGEYEDTVSVTPTAIAAALNGMRSFDKEEFFRALYYGLDVSAREELRRAIRS